MSLRLGAHVDLFPFAQVARLANAKHLSGWRLPNATIRPRPRMHVLRFHEGVALLFRDGFHAARPKDGLQFIEARAGTHRPCAPSDACSFLFARYASLIQSGSSCFHSTV